MTNYAILDLKVGNINSVINACAYLGYNLEVVSAESFRSTYSHIILPGVGRFDKGSAALTPDIRAQIHQHVKAGSYLLGICLGMQLLFDESEESKGQGLGLIPGKITKLARPGIKLQLPRLGWKTVRYGDTYNGVLGKPRQRSRYYFVHSYGYLPSPEDVSELSIENKIVYDINDSLPITASIEYNNVIGTQYHPEKSSAFGLDILNSFFSNCS